MKTLEFPTLLRLNAAAVTLAPHLHNAYQEVYGGLAIPFAMLPLSVRDAYVVSAAEMIRTVHEEKTR